MYDYQIDAILKLNVKEANKAIDDAIEKIASLEGKINSNASSTNNATKYNKEYNESYKSLNPSVEKLTSDLNDNHKENDKLMNSIKKTHKSLLDSNASVNEARKVWRKFADEHGLGFTNGRLRSSLRDTTLEMTNLGNTTKNVTNAQKVFKQEFDKIRSSLNSGTLDIRGFHSQVNNLADRVSRKYNVNIRRMGDASFAFKERVGDAETACKNFNRVLSDVNAKIQKGTFKDADLANFRMARNELAKSVMTMEEYNEMRGKTGVSLRNLTNYINENSKSLNINNTTMGTFNRRSQENLNMRNRIGGTLASLTNNTAAYNKMLTTVTRSQRMQNYAMQVSALRYNAVANALGFVGGMLGTQLVMGFAEARIESIRFEQQAQQMLKTSDLSTKEIDKLTTAVENYTKANRKLNTAGLKYTVAQVTKLNGLTEEQAEKAIPVIADITNMMTINGRSQEDSILAVNDALDGQFKRLQEIGVSGKDMLKDFGWNGETGTAEGTKTMLEALDKIGKKKGWSDLTRDVTTLDDAYKVLGNTIDDFLTPAITSITPTIVKTIQAFSGLLSVLGNAPLVFQGLAAGIGIVGVSFGKMKFEMLKAKILGSEFMARLTGLDDGMYGISKSIGAVNLAVQDGTISFQQGTKVLMNHHQETVRASMTYDEATEALNRLKEAELTYEATLDGLEGEEALRTQNIINNIKAQFNEIGMMRELDQRYASYKLAMANANSETKMRLGNIQRLLGASDSEMAHIITTTSVLNKATGEIEIFDRYTGELNKDLQKLGLTSEEVNSFWRSVKASDKTGMTGLFTKGSEKSKKLEKNLLGLNKATELNRKTTFNNNAVQGIANKLRKTGTSAVEAEKIAIGAINAVEEEGIIIEEASATAKMKKNFITKADTLATDANTVAQQLNTAQIKMGSKGLTKYLFNLKATTAAIWDNVKSLAAKAAAQAIEDPIGTAIAIAAVAAAIALCNNLIQEQIGLQNSLSKYNSLLSEGRDKLDKLDEKLQKTKQNTKEYNALLARRNALEKEYNKALALNDYSEMSYDTSRGTISESAESLKSLYKQKYGFNFDFSELSSAEKEIKSLNDYQIRFSLTAEDRNKKLQKYMEDSGKSTNEMKQFSNTYLQQQLDVIDATEKMKSDDFMTRIGGYWDNWWAHVAMGWTEYWAQNNLSDFLFGDLVNFDSWWKNSVEDPINNGITDLAKSWDNFWKPISDFLNGLSTDNSWELPNPLQMLSDWIDTESINTSEWLNSVLPSVDDVKQGIRTNLIEPFQAWFNNPFGDLEINDTSTQSPLLKRIGISEETKQYISSKLEELVSTITYWLNPENWAIEGTDSITNWWNTNVADPLNGAVSILGADLHIGGQNAGNNLKNGLDNGSKGSSDAVNNNLSPIDSVINTLGGVFSSSANKAGGNIKSGIKTGSSGASSPVRSEMDYINQIMNSYGGTGGSFFTTASNVASVIISGIKAGLNQHSPGDASKAVLDEMGYTIAFMEEQQPLIEESASVIGESIVNGISNVSDMDLSMDIGSLLEQTQYIADTQLATETLKSQITTNNSSIMASNNAMGTNTQAEYATIQDTVTNSFLSMSNIADKSLTDIATLNNKEMVTFRNDTKAGMDTSHNIMRDRLNNMQNSTLLATNNMTKAWNTMKNSIIKSATTIRTESYNKFNSLHKSISSFYKQIQTATFNYGTLPAGSSDLIKHGSSRSFSRKISSTTNKGSKGFSSNIKRYGGLSLNDDTDYLKILKRVLNNQGTRNDINKLYEKGYFNEDGKYFGAIDTNAHVSTQLNNAYKWKMKSPSMYGIPLGMNDMTVGDFRDGKSSPFTYSNFEHYLRTILGARGFNDPSTYSFYWNSQKSNQQVWDSVSCNCCDGAELIVEIAKDMGLNDAYTVNGHWGSLGHVAAKVGGKIYDMTQFQHGGSFRGHPKVSFNGSYNGNPTLLNAGKANKGKALKWGSVRKRYGGTSNNINKNKKIINLTVTGNTFLSERDYENKIKNISKRVAEDVFYEVHSNSDVLGY